VKTIADQGTLTDCIVNALSSIELDPLAQESISGNLNAFPLSWADPHFNPPASLTNGGTADCRELKKRILANPKLKEKS